jgi:hypothetical protein
MHRIICQVLFRKMLEEAELGPTRYRGVQQFLKEHLAELV